METTDVIAIVPLLLIVAVLGVALAAQIATLMEPITAYGSSCLSVHKIAGATFYVPEVQAGSTTWLGTKPLGLR